MRKRQKRWLRQQLEEEATILNTTSTTSTTTLRPPRSPRLRQRPQRPQQRPLQLLQRVLPPRHTGQEEHLAARLLQTLLLLLAEVAEESRASPLLWPAPAPPRRAPLSRSARSPSPTPPPRSRRPRT